MAVTQKEIAQHLGMSRAQVGLALQGRGTVAPATRDRILQAAREMGYHAGSNREARALIARRYGHSVLHGSVLLTHPLQGKPFSLVRDAPFFEEFFDGAESEAGARDLDVILCATREGRPLPRLMSDNFVDGAVCVGAGEVEALQARGLRTIALDFPSPHAVSLVPDDKGGIYATTRYLLELGHHRIAYLHYGEDAPFTSNLVTQNRRRGYEQALAEAGVALDTALVATTIPEMTHEAGELATRELLETGVPFTALACYNDWLAIGALRALYAAGLRVPEDVSVTGFDDISMRVGCVPLLTSVFFDREAMGRRAVELIYNGEELAPHTELFPVRLQVRESTRRVN